MGSGNSPRVVIYEQNGDNPLVGPQAASGSLPVVIANDQTVAVSGTIFTQPVPGVTGSITGSVGITGPITGTVGLSGPITGSVGISGPVAVTQGTSPWDISGSAWTPSITGSVVVTNRVDVSGSAWTPTVTGSLKLSEPITGSVGITGPITGSVGITGPLTGTFGLSGPITGTVGIAASVAVTQGTSPWDVSGSTWTPTVTGSVVVANQVNVTGSGWTPTVTGSVQVTNVVNVTGSEWIPRITGSVSINLGDAGRNFRPIFAEPTGGRQNILSASVVTAASGTVLTWQGWSEWYLACNVLGPVGGTNPKITFIIDHVDPIDKVTVLQPRDQYSVSGSLTGSGFIVLELPDSFTDTFRISWEMSGANPVFSGTNVSWMGHAGGNSIEGSQNPGQTIVSSPIVIAGSDAEGRAQFLLLDSSGRLVTTDPATQAAINGFSYGTVATAAVTNVAVRNTTYTEQTASFTRSIASANANDTAAGTGARVVKLTYYNYDFNGPFTESLTLNGTTGVNTVSSNICFIEKMEVTSVGTGGVPAGIITLYQSVNKTGGTIGTIAAGDNQTFWAHHYIPSGSSCFVTSYTGNNNHSSNATLFSITSQQSGSTSPVRILSDTLVAGAAAGQNQRTFGTALGFDGPGRLTMFAAPGGTPTTTHRASFDFYEQSGSSA